MNWNKLQEMQLALDNAILQAKSKMSAKERFNKTLVALSVEVSEISNCSEHFKFWKDNKGKVDNNKYHHWAEVGANKEWYEYYDEDGSTIQISVDQAHKLTLVEECSDALHFILSLANQLNEQLIDVVERYDNFNQEEWYLEILTDIKNMKWDENNKWRALRDLNIDFYHYYSSLGITTQELEQAYYDKNKVNYERLREGY
ncbi:dUTP diphosphatase [Vagococcus fluvialis]|uniref:Dimeric dUTPase (All-alpha-NTP-PPase superfamily) n=1 Tax=Vagococcus fluvialis TaxID=2738 RepID=A0A7X6D7F5_9ENTE|nr:dUTP diphosphatase [Vagococcus fluvialis]NKC67199.1 hypothetical protein [Vagococcus fluvialis]